MDGPAAELACIILSHGGAADVLEALRSLAIDDTRKEVVVIHLGAADVTGELRNCGDAKVIHAPSMNPGAARNVGVAATSAPFVAFLATPSVAGPGWVTERLALHRAGARAVAGSVKWAEERDVVDRATAIVRGVPADVSYDRTLLREVGPFRADLEIDEDSDYFERLAKVVSIERATRATLIARAPRRFDRLVSDQFRSGFRTARAWQRRTGIEQGRHVALDGVLRETPTRLLAAMGTTSLRRRLEVLAAAPTVGAGAIAFALGALRSARSDGDIATQPPQWIGRGGDRPRLIALLVFRDEMRYLPTYFQNVAPHVDGILALDDGSTDGSTDFVASQPSVLELVRISNVGRTHWDEVDIHRRVVEASWKHVPDWLVAIDADERVERNFRARITEITREAEKLRCFAFSLRLLELWDRPDRYRADGIWNGKSVARLFKARADHHFDERAYHGHYAPLNSRVAGQFPPVDAILYHLKMIDARDRQARKERYQQLDPNNQWQSIGYDYLTDTTNLRLRRLPWRREYAPL